MYIYLYVHRSSSEIQFGGSLRHRSKQACDSAITHGVASVLSPFIACSDAADVDILQVQYYLRFRISTWTALVHSSTTRPLPTEVSER